MSTNSTVVGTMLVVLEMSASTCRRSSGTETMPVLGSMVQKGKLAACAWPFLTIALKRVDLPTFGSPTMPVLSADDATLLHARVRVVSRMAALVALQGLLQASHARAARLCAHNAEPQASFSQDRLCS